MTCWTFAITLLILSARNAANIPSTSHTVDRVLTDLILFYRMYQPTRSWMSRIVPTTDEQLLTMLNYQCLLLNIKYNQQQEHQQLIWKVQMTKQNISYLMHNIQE
jgi:hypothetical protein